MATAMVAAQDTSFYLPAEPLTFTSFPALSPTTSQVMIPDVQKLINQSGNVSSDIFNTRLIKPPTSVLVFPLKVGVCV